MKDSSPALYELLLDKLDTYEKLELVLSLRAAQAPLTIAAIAHQLQVGREALRRVATAVVDTGIIESVATDVLQYRDGSWTAVLDEAAALYTTDPKHLMRLFTRVAMERIRGMAARNFADAFMLRRKAK